MNTHPDTLSPADLAISQPRTLHRAQVALMLGISDRTFSNHLPTLLHKGFPAKLPGLNRWSRVAVELWIDCGGATDTGDGMDDPDEEADDLLARYGKLSLAVDNG